MILFNHIRANNTHGGQPQRGFIVQELREGSKSAAVIDFIDEGYAGKSELYDKYPDAIEMCSIDVEPKEYKHFKKNYSK